jgi:hypothetical protein
VRLPFFRCQRRWKHGRWMGGWSWLWIDVLHGPLAPGPQVQGVWDDVLHAAGACVAASGWSFMRSAKG